MKTTRFESMRWSPRSRRRKIIWWRSPIRPVRWEWKVDCGSIWCAYDVANRRNSKNNRMLSGFPCLRFIVVPVSLPLCSLAIPSGRPFLSGGRFYQGKTGSCAQDAGEEGRRRSKPQIRKMQRLSPTIMLREKRRNKGRGKKKDERMPWRNLSKKRIRMIL